MKQNKIKSKLKCAMIFFFKKVANKERIFLLLFEQCEVSAQTLLQGGRAGLANRKLFLFWSPGPVKVHSVFLALLCALYSHSTDPGALWQPSSHVAPRWGCAPPGFCFRTNTFSAFTLLQGKRLGGRADFSTVLFKLWRPDQQHQHHLGTCLKCTLPGILSGSVGKSLPANAGDMGLIPGPGRPHMLQDN